MVDCLSPTKGFDTGCRRKIKIKHTVVPMLPQAIALNLSAIIPGEEVKKVLRLTETIFGLKWEKDTHKIYKNLMCFSQIFL